MGAIIQPFGNAFKTFWKTIESLDNLPSKWKKRIFIGTCLTLGIGGILMSYFVIYISDLNDITYLERNGFTVTPRTKRIRDFQIAGYDFGRDLTISYELTNFPMDAYDETNLHKIKSAVGLLYKPVWVKFRVTPTVTKLTGFEELSNLHLLQVQDAYGLTDVSNLQHSNNLKSLVLLGCHTLKKLNGLEKNKSVTELWFTECQQFNDWKALEQMPQMTVISLAGNEVLSDLSVLTNVSGLRYMDLSYCPNLTNFKALKEMKSLKKIILTGCGLTQKEQTGIRKELPHLTIRFEEKVTE